MKVTIERDFPLTDCGDIAVTAAEGGINYWAVVDSYDWWRWDPEGTDVSLLERGDAFVFYTIVSDCDGDPFWPTIPITPALIKRGYEMLLAGGARRDLVEQALSAILDNEIGGVDAEVADCVIQLGAFEEIVYG